VDLKFKIIARLIDKLVSLDVKYEAIFEKVPIHLVSFQNLQEISFYFLCLGTTLMLTCKSQRG
jgi:hypothetical protein